MTKEQEEAVDYVQKQIDYFKKQIRFIEFVDRTYYAVEYKLYKNRVKQFETVLNMLKEQREENKKKDKQIDLMAEEIRIPVIEPIITIKKFGIKPENKFTNTTRYMTKEEVKQYFERKVTKND